MKFGSRFARVSQELLAWIQDWSRDVRLAPEFNEGELVSITEGPFRSMDAIFKTYDGEWCAIPLLDLLAKMIKAKFGLRLIKKASLVSWMQADGSFNHLVI